MNTQRITGLVLLGIGVTLLVIGMNASHSFSDQVSQTFTGRFTQATAWYIVGGIGCSLLGALLVLFGVGGRHAS